MNHAIIVTIEELKKMIKEYKITGTQPQIGFLDDFKETLENGVELSLRQKMTIYSQLFPPRGGLSDAHYWHDNFEIRKEVNDQLHKLKKQLSDYLLER